MALIRKGSCGGVRKPSRGAVSGVGVTGMHGAGWGGEIVFCGMRMQTMRTWFIMADAEVAENVGF